MATAERSAGKNPDGKVSVTDKYYFAWTCANVVEEMDVVSLVMGCLLGKVEIWSLGNLEFDFLFWFLWFLVIVRVWGIVSLVFELFKVVFFVVLGVRVLTDLE